MHDDHDHDHAADSGSQVDTSNPWPDRVNEAYYDSMGATFGQKTRDRINWMCSQAIGSSVLDVGCSQGIASILMAREGMKVVGIDIFRPAVEYALMERAKEIESVQQRLEFRCSELASIDSEKFDTVLMGEVIEHQTNPVKFISQAAALVAPGGRVVITVPFGLHPWPDHKSTVFPRDIASAIGKEFRFRTLEVVDGYIRVVSDRCTADMPEMAPDILADAQALLIATEKGTLESQCRYYAIQANYQTLNKSGTELEGRLRALQTERNELAERQRDLDKELALRTHSVETLHATLAEFKAHSSGQAELALEHEAAREARSNRIEALLQEVTVHKAISERTSQALVDVETARQANANRIEELLQEVAVQKALSERATLAMVDAETAHQANAERIEGLVAEVASLKAEREEVQQSLAKIEALSIGWAKDKSAYGRALEALGISENRLAQTLGELDETREALAAMRQQNEALLREGEVLKARLHAVHLELSVAQYKRSGHYSHLLAERDRSVKLIDLAKELHEENQRFRNSIALAVGQAFLGLRSPRGFVAFPSAMLRAISSLRRRANNGLALEQLKLPRLEAVVLPQQRAAAAAAPQPATRRGAPAKKSGDPPKALSATGWTQDLDPAAISVMTVLDEFSRSCFAPHANLIEPRPDNWEGLLESFRPNFLLVESCWKGNYGTWQYRVSNYANPPGRELSEMVEGFRARGIPTVFWNKEDPVHFSNFIDNAARFDLVLTTASEAIPRYEEKTAHRVGSLQFAAEESLHNPTGSAERNDKVCFAGSFYANRFHERRDDQLMLLDAAAGFDFDIFDRNYDPKTTTPSDFAFPERFSRFVRGRLPYDAIGSAYRQYRVFLNVNSVVDSPTMFSRRVFELLACGTPVVSTWSRGTEDTFGNDLVWHVRDQEEAREAICTLMTDDREWRRRSLAGIRAVMSQHTYRHRFRKILEMINQKVPDQDAFGNLLVVAEVANQVEADAVAASFSRQGTDARVKKRLVIVSREQCELAGTDAEIELLIDQEKTLADVISQTYSRGTSRLLATMSPFAVYGRHHLQDLIHAARYSRAAVVGKAADGLDASQYRFGVQLDPSAIVINEPTVMKTGGKVADLLTADGLRLLAAKDGCSYGSDSANFLRTEFILGNAQTDEVLGSIEL